MEFVPTDESLDYPALPLAPPDNYAWSIYDFEGKEVPVTQSKGKTLFLNMWATWCPPCRAEMPTLNHLYEEMKEKNVAFVFLSEEKPATVKQFISNNKYTLD